MSFPRKLSNDVPAIIEAFYDLDYVQYSEEEIRQTPLSDYRYNFLMFDSFGREYDKLPIENLKIKMSNDGIILYLSIRDGDGEGERWCRTLVRESAHILLSIEMYNFLYGAYPKVPMMVYIEKGYLNFRSINYGCEPNGKENNQCSSNDYRIFDFFLQFPEFNMSWMQICLEEGYRYAMCYIPMYLYHSKTAPTHRKSVLVPFGTSPMDYLNEHHRNHILTRRANIWNWGDFVVSEAEIGRYFILFDKETKTEHLFECQNSTENPIYLP